MRYFTAWFSLYIKNDHIIQDKEEKIYIFISIHIVNEYHTKSVVFFLKNQHDYKYYIDFIGLQQFDKQKVNIKRGFRLHFACFALFRQQKTF